MKIFIYYEESPISGFLSQAILSMYDDVILWYAILKYYKNSAFKIILSLHPNFVILNLKTTQNHVIYERITQFYHKIINYDLFISSKIVLRSEFRMACMLFITFWMRLCRLRIKLLKVSNDIYFAHTSLLVSLNAWILEDRFSWIIVFDNLIYIFNWSQIWVLLRPV